MKTRALYLSRGLKYPLLNPLFSPWPRPLWGGGGITTIMDSLYRDPNHTPNFVALLFKINTKYRISVLIYPYFDVSHA